MDYAEGKKNEVRGHQHRKRGEGGIQAIAKATKGVSKGNGRGGTSMDFGEWGS